MGLRPFALWGTVLFALGAFLGGAGAGGGCFGTNTCVCHLDEGDLDLRPTGAKPTDVYTVNTFDSKTEEYTLDTYYFRPCGDTFLGNQTDPNNKCKDSSICRHSVHIKGSPTTNATVSDLGFQSLGQFTNSKLTGPLKEIALVYDVDAVKTVIYLICKQGQNSLQIISPTAGNPMFNFYSADACLKEAPEPTHHSFGTTLLIIFLVLAVVYLVTGCLVKYILMGARGIEILPNLNFWKELPSLVRDGLSFVQNGFKPPPQSTPSPGQNPNPNSYDSI